MSFLHRPSSTVLNIQTKHIYHLHPAKPPILRRQPLNLIRNIPILTPHRRRRIEQPIRIEFLLQSVKSGILFLAIKCCDIISLLIPSVIIKMKIENNKQ